MPFSLTTPADQAHASVGVSVDFVGVADDGVVRVELTIDDQAAGPPVMLNAGTWSATKQFSTRGPHTVTARAFDVDDLQVGRSDVTVMLDVPALVLDVPIPPDINGGLTSAQQNTMIEIFPQPCELTDNDAPITNLRLRQHLVQNVKVGPLTVTGLRPAVDTLTRIIAAAEQREPDLIKALGTQGMLVCRKVRPVKGQPPSPGQPPHYSNHSWGIAIDLTINGKTHDRNEKTFVGLLMLCPFFNAERFFWGAGFRKHFQDPMHFEASDELVRDWEAQGLLNP